MLHLPMNMPAELHRVGAAACGRGSVARAPLVILAHGLLAIDPERRDEFVIRSALGEFSASEAEAALRDWNAPRKA